MGDTYRNSHHPVFEDKATFFSIAFYLTVTANYFDFYFQNAEFFCLLNAGNEFV